MRTICIVLVLFAKADTTSGQTSELYVNQVSDGEMVVVQGGEVIRSWELQTRGENALAVAGTVRTAGNLLNNYNGTGGEYSRNGTLINYSYNILPPGNWFDDLLSLGNWFDGTTDGVLHNYAIQHNRDYQLYQFDREWKNPQPLFFVGFPASGIALDRRTSTFWICDSLTKRIRQIDMSGEVISSFTVDGTGSLYGLAFDPADRTIWVGGYKSNSIHQFDLIGNRLDRVEIPGFNSAFGMEFAVPEPTAGMLIFLALLFTVTRSFKCL